MGAIFHFSAEIRLKSDENVVFFIFCIPMGEAVVTPGPLLRYCYYLTSYRGKETNNLVEPTT